MNLDLFFHRKSGWPRLTPIAIAICIVIYCGLNLQGSNPTWAKYSHWGFFPGIFIWVGKPWILVTSVFVHLEIWHIAFNMFWLWLLGNCLEEEIGPGLWLLFFLAAAWVSSALQLLTSGYAGFGISGVLYAMFGFGWVAGRRIPAFKTVLDERAIYAFSIWLVWCMVGTYFKIVNFGNAAHIAGLAFGAAVAAVFVLRWRLPLSIAGLTLLVAASIAPLFWCPLSPDWRSVQTMKAANRLTEQNARIWQKLWQSR